MAAKLGSRRVLGKALIVNDLVYGDKASISLRSPPRYAVVARNWIEQQATNLLRGFESLRPRFSKSRRCKEFISTALFSCEPTSNRPGDG